MARWGFTLPRFVLLSTPLPLHRPGEQGQIRVAEVPARPQGPHPERGCRRVLPEADFP